MSQEARAILLDDFKRAKFSRNEINKSWRRWLESGEQYLDITFESKCWKDNSFAVLLSVTHPLVKLAAEYLQSKGQVVTTLRVKSDKFASGEYPFAIYQWKLSGEREDIQMMPVSANSNLNRVIFELLKESYGINYKLDVKENGWKAVEATHHSVWSSSLAEHKEKTAELINYKEASLKTSHIARMQSLEEALDKHRTKKNYVQMMTGKIRIAQEDFELHLLQLEDAKNSADILFELLAYGLLVIEPEIIEAPNKALIDVMAYVAKTYGIDIIHNPSRLLGMISDLAPEQTKERRKLKLLFDIGILDILNVEGMDGIDSIVELAKDKLGYEKEETCKLLQYLNVFYGKEVTNESV